MKPKMIRLLANILLWIAVVAGLGGCALALALSMSTNYIPEAWHFYAIGGGVALFIVIAIVLHAVANVREKRLAIRECWNAAEEADAAVIGEEPETDENTTEDVETDATEDVADVEAEESKNKLQVIREKIVEKTPLTEEQLDKAEKIGKVAVPVGAACVVLLMAAKLKGYKASATRRQTFYKWLG